MRLLLSETLMNALIRYLVLSETMVLVYTRNRQLFWTIRGWRITWISLSFLKETDGHFQIPGLYIHPLRDDCGAYAFATYTGTRIG